MKVCIVALDALEYEMVEKLYLENLKQIEYGRIDLTEFIRYSPTGEPWTPVVWSSFVTGLMPNRTKVTVERRYSNPIMEGIRNLAYRFGLADTIVDMISIRRKDWIKREILGPIGFSTLEADPWKIDREYYRKMKLQTIFEFSENPVIVAMPTFKPYQGKGWELAEMFMNRRITKAEFIRKEIDEFEREINNAFISLRKPWDLFVFYTTIIDSVGHFLASDTRAMWYFYDRADKFVEKLARRVGGKTFILVISDHGMKRTGRHSDHAFYSTNIPMNLEDPKITDFYDIITRRLVHHTHGGAH